MLLSAVAQLTGPNCKLPQGQLQQVTSAFVTKVLQTTENTSTAVSAVLSAVAKMEGEVMPVRQLQQLLQVY
jgi:phage-related protein